MPSRSYTSFGFTLIELLVVVSILLIISGALIPNFSTYINNQNVKQAQESLKSDLRSVQNKAINGALSSYVYTGTTPIQYWAVSLTSDSGTYQVFVSNTVACPNPIPATQLQQTITLQNSLVVKNTGCLFFSVYNGDISTTTLPGNGSISVGYSGKTNDKQILYNPSGLIYNIN